MNHYEKLMRDVERSDDDSAEKAEKIRSLFMQRTIAATRYGAFGAFGGKTEQGSIRALKRLPRLPQDHIFYDQQKIKDEDTMVLVPTRLPEEGLAGAERRSQPQIKAKKLRAEDVPLKAIVSSIVVGINGVAEPRPSTNNEILARTGFANSRSDEAIQRTGFMIDSLCQGGTLEGNGPILVLLQFRNSLDMYVYYDGEFALVPSP
ncbi:hypothetical protein ONZ43_g4153 [Nemania bipapillata]|uniref:Uncharacterized protein n=1 Tax=Nemania bipapillata TaxID=110536 RepID=A0ACC2IR55_9PEZI|nr:hypothetical protein ONZ43_g4153 [Nemania bipapillata]